LSPSEPWRNPRPAPNLDEVRHRVPPKSLIPGWLHAWWPALLWSAFIFTASTDAFSSVHTAAFFEPLLRWLHPPLTVEQFDFLHNLIRKAAHLAEYFIFFLLLLRGIRGARSGWRWTWALSAWFIAVAYSALDEIHQSFVASRTASARDSLIDSTGAFLAFIAAFLFYKFLRSRARQ
jgi:VanZ family protein